MISDNELALLLRIARRHKPTNAELARFMTESNAIEGGKGLHPNDVEAARRFLSRPISEASLLGCHGLLAAHLSVDWAGRYRDCDVWVGEYVAPSHEQVPALMAKFWRALPKLDAWEAHNKFQKIHPLRDLNGRTGRLIWLHKALEEGYAFRIGFLHAYYYQTLNHQKPLPK